MLAETGKTWNTETYGRVRRTPASTGFRYPEERVMVAVKATNLTPFVYLADGAIVLRVSVQRAWVYARVSIHGVPRTRRYRHEQMVEIESS